MKRLTWGFLFLIFITFSSPALCSSKLNPLQIHTQKSIIEYQVELALTPQEQTQGLMHRRELPSQHGMLFLFQQPRVARMWMQNTFIPLDMIFFNEEGVVTFVHHNAKPLDTTIISSPQKVAGVLETNAMEAEKYGIQEGTIIDLKTLKY